MSTFIATGAGGLEEFMDRELAELGVNSRARLHGALLFDGPEFPSRAGFALLRRLNQHARGIDRVGVLLGRGEIHDAGHAGELARAVDYRELLAGGRSFAVRARRQGTHAFGSLDLARAVGSAVIDAQSATGSSRPPVSLDAPEVILRAELRDDSFRLWLDATGDTLLYQRDYRRQLHPASMRASMAHLLLRVAGWRGEPLLDPMTGIGTIPIEAALWAHGVSPGSLRTGPTALELIDPHGPGEPLAKADDALPPLRSRPEPLDVRGIERYESHVQGAWLNLAAAGVPAGVRIEVGDACRLERSIAAGRYRLAVLNPPFGRRVGSTGMVTDLYRRFARSVARCGIRRVVTLAESYRTMAQALQAAGYRVDGTAVEYGDLPVHVLVGDLAEASG